MQITKRKRETFMIVGIVKILDELDYLWESISSIANGESLLYSSN
jgi:hypothetical protein